MKVLFVGFGSIAQKHKNAMDVSFPGTQYFALRSSQASKAIDGVESLFSWDEIPAGIDFAIVSNPTAHHTEAMHELVDRGIPVMIEKPVSDRLDGLEELASKIRSKQLPVYVACNLRFAPVLQFLHDKLQGTEVRINEVLVYAGSYLPDWRPGTNFRENYSARADMGGGAHLDLFHELDYVTWLFGKPQSSSSTLRSVSSLGITAVDFASYTWEYPGFTATILLNYFRRKPKRSIEIVLAEDTWLVDILQSRITSDNGEVIYDEGPYNLKDTYIAQIQYFVEAVKQKKYLNINTFEDSLQILKNCLHSNA
ncbi:Gfo/Idh/MocA family protein [Chitinophaga caseinilytica]|uniref:Gfo/Idh/MocA family protein n=1 Tax=Chitinophaga caseinilytica TaxID=2267521 RepID=UPI003C30CAB4